jgi:hypothetical protein
VSSVKALAAGLALLLVGCLPKPLPLYRQPLPNAPHAWIKLRRVHHTTPGPLYTGAMSINEFRLELAPQSTLTEAASQAIRVRPEHNVWKTSAEFYHNDSRTETYNTTEYYSCGSGNSTQSCSRLVQKTRSILIHVTDASCQASLRHTPEAGGLYLLQFDFYGKEQCSLKCFIQTPQPAGGFQLTPCPEEIPLSALEK